MENLENTIKVIEYLTHLPRTLEQCEVQDLIKEKQPELILAAQEALKEITKVSVREMEKVSENA